MICKDCGKELKLVTHIPQEEIPTLLNIAGLIHSSRSALDSKIINLNELEDQEVFDYLVNAFEVHSKAAFFKIEFLRNISEKVPLDLNHPDIYDFDETGIYIH